MTDFQKFLIKYCAKHHCTEAEAKQHATVRATEEYYAHKNDGKIATTTNVQFGCGGASMGGDCK